MSQEEMYTYNVKQASFEGPLELLLSLVEQKKLFINDISLAEVTNDYIDHVKSISENTKGGNIADVSYFVLIASTLILIKSKSLLPNLLLTEDENEKIIDLETRLKLYQIIKGASLDIKNNFGLNIIFYPEERVWNEPLFSPDPLITKINIENYAKEIINKAPKKIESLPRIEIKKIININEVIENLTNRIESAINLSFREFTNSRKNGNELESRVNVIVSFLAMLELVREGIIDVIQNVSFGDIEMNKQELLTNQEE